MGMMAQISSLTQKILSESIPSLNQQSASHEGSPKPLL